MSTSVSSNSSKQCVHVFKSGKRAGQRCPNVESSTESHKCKKCIANSQAYYGKVGKNEIKFNQQECQRLGINVESLVAQHLEHLKKEKAKRKYCDHTNCKRLVSSANKFCSKHYHEYDHKMWFAYKQQHNGDQTGYKFPSNLRDQPAKSNDENAKVNRKLSFDDNDESDEEKSQDNSEGEAKVKFQDEASEEFRDEKANSDNSKNEEESQDENEDKDEEKSKDEKVKSEDDSASSENDVEVQKKSTVNTCSHSTCKYSILQNIIYCPKHYLEYLRKLQSLHIKKYGNDATFKYPSNKIALKSYNEQLEKSLSN